MSRSAFLKHPHDLLFQISRETAMEQADFKSAKVLPLQFFVHFEGGLDLVLFVLLNYGIDDVGLMSSCNLLADKFQTFWGFVVGDAARDDRGAPGGNSSITLMSRSPYSVSASVRGMGVAVMTRTSGSPEGRIFS